MANRIEILDPTSTPQVVARPLSPRKRDLSGARIGFLSNKKANADALLDELERLLRERLGAFEVHRAAKTAPLPAPEEVLRGLSRCMAVVTAVAD